MAILNYTTSVPVSRTVAEIHKILGKHGAIAINTKMLGGEPVGISFTVESTVTFTAKQLRNYVMPIEVEGVLKALGKSATRANKDQAARVAWRIAKDWIEAQLALVQAQQALMESVFMPYLVINKYGQTLSHYLLFDDGMQKLLPG